MGKIIYYDINQGVLRNVGNDMHILDIGCGPGYLGEKIKQKYPNTVVYGIDNLKEPLKIAQTKLDKVFWVDVEEESKKTFKKTKKDTKKEKTKSVSFGNLYKLKKNSLDIIIFGDILEHLEEPCIVIRNYKQYLKKDGRMIISLPNVASWNIRLKLLFGNFTYTESGILDESHIKFYTLKTAKKLAEDNGLYVEKVDITPNIIRAFVPLIRIIFSAFNTKKQNKEYNVNESIFNSKFYSIYCDYLSPIETIIAKIWKRLFAYQFILINKIKK